jgi:hypothetical protein
VFSLAKRRRVSRFRIGGRHRDVSGGWRNGAVGGAKASGGRPGWGWGKHMKTEGNT